MKDIVIYESKTGFTMQYAQWIAQALGCEARPLKGVTAEALAAYDTVIFGGWIFAKRIQGWDKLKALVPKPAAVYAVGAAPLLEGGLEAIRAENALGDLPLFYMQGGLRYDKLGFIMGGMLKLMGRSLRNKKDPSEEERMMGEAMSQSYDCSSQEAIQPLVEGVRARG